MHSIGYMPTSTSVLKCPLVFSFDLALLLATNKGKKSQQASFWLYAFKPQTVSTDQPEKKTVNKNEHAPTVVLKSGGSRYGLTGHFVTFIQSEHASN